MFNFQIFQNVVINIKQLFTVMDSFDVVKLGGVDGLVSVFK